MLLGQREHLLAFTWDSQDLEVRWVPGMELLGLISLGLFSLLGSSLWWGEDGSQLSRLTSSWLALPGESAQIGRAKCSRCIIPSSGTRSGGWENFPGLALRQTRTRSSGSFGTGNLAASNF